MEFRLRCTRESYCHGRCNQYGDTSCIRRSGKGVFGEVTGKFGVGVAGLSNDMSLDGKSYGGKFISASPNGYGVWGEAQNPGGTGVGGYSGLAYGIGVAGYGGANGYDFYATGPGTNYGVGSSIRWKRNIREIDQALDKVLNLRGVYFDWDEAHGGKHGMGFIAEEVGKQVPEIVSYEKDRGQCDRHGLRRHYAYACPGH